MLVEYIKAYGKIPVGRIAAVTTEKGLELITKGLVKKCSGDATATEDYVPHVEEEE